MEDIWKEINLSRPTLPDLFSLCSKSSGMAGEGDRLQLHQSSGDAGDGDRLQLHQSSSIAGDGDRRHKRMIKNRESAARSKARKQAYTNELEREVARLVEENAELKEQNEKLRLAVPAQFLRTRNTLKRTLTAPF